MSRAVLTEAQFNRLRTLMRSGPTLRKQTVMKQAERSLPVAKALDQITYEADIENALVTAMQLDGWRAFKQEYNFDTVKKLTLGEPGMCDHLFLRPHNQGDPRGPVPHTATRCYNPLCDVLWWEFKASIRRRKRREFLSTDQVVWIEAERRKGFLVWVAGLDHDADIPGAARHYLESGLARRREVFERLIPR